MFEIFDKAYEVEKSSASSSEKCRRIVDVVGDNIYMRDWVM